MARRLPSSPLSPMWFTSRRITHGWFTDIPSWLGRAGIRTRESGLGGRIFRSDSVSESAGSAVLDGDGVIGASTGITTPCCLTTAGTSHGAELFIIGAITTGAALRAGVLMAHAPELITIPERGPGLSTETGRRLADTQHLTARAASTRAHTVAMAMADRPGAFRHADRRASAGEQRLTAERRTAEGRTAAAGGTDRGG